MAKVAIVGCGAMGSVYAALMASAGHDVHGITLWSEHVRAIQQRGLRVEGASGDRTVRIHAAETCDNIGPCDLVIIATKAFDVADACIACASLIGDRTVVQTIQNGLGSADVAAPIVGPDRLAVGVVGGFGASLREPGHVHHNGMEMIRFGSYGRLSRTDLDRSAEIWRSAGFKVALFDDINRMIWEKLIMNVTFSGSTTVTGFTIGEVMENPEAWSVALACAREAIAVAEAAGITLEVGDPIEHIRNLGAGIPNARPSMLIDHSGNLRGEVDVINGAISRLGHQLGVPTPTNDTLVAVIKAREAKFPASPSSQRRNGSDHCRA